MVKIIYYATLRNSLGLKEEIIDFAGPVSKLLDILLSKYGDKLREKLFNDNALISNVIILKNGINIKFIAGLNTEISNEDELDIFPPVAGG